MSKNTRRTPAKVLGDRLTVLTVAAKAKALAEDAGVR
jgi:hypothetical protein